MEYLLLIVGFVLLVKCSDIFVEGSSNLAKVLGVPSLIIGLTIVAFGTSAPEASVSIISAIEGKSGMSVGNVIGSNICNILLVLGASSLFHYLKANKQILFKDFLFLLLSYFILIFLAIDGFTIKFLESHIARNEGLILLSFLGIYMYSLVSSLSSNKTKEERKKFELKDIFKIAFGLVGIIMGGNVVVDAGTMIARSFNVSEHLIGLTIVGIGTSLPELFTSVTAIKKGENDIAIGNVIGSNIFNILFILGASSVIAPLTISSTMFTDIMIMLSSGLLVYLFALHKGKITRKKGIIMLLIYFSYIIYIINR